MNMTVEKASALLVQAKNDGIYEGPTEGTDEFLVTEATKIFTLAHNAWEQNVRGPEVEAILRIGNEDFPAEGETPESNKATEKSWEKLEKEDEILEAERLAEPELADLSTIEPWHGYDEMPIPEILKEITKQAGELEDDDTALGELLQHVWAYESARRNRGTVLGRLEKLGKRLLEKEEANGEESEEGVEEKPQAEGEDRQEEPRTEDSSGDEAEDDLPDEDSRSDVPGVGNGSELDGGERPVADADLDTEPEADEPAEERGGEQHEAEPVHEDERESRPSSPERTEVEDSPTFATILAEVTATVQDQRDHIPDPPGDAIPELPWDWTTLSDSELQKFYSAFSYLAYYKNYTLTRDERIALECKQAADEIVNSILGDLEKYDEKGKAKSVTVLEAEAESNETVRHWRRAQRKYEGFAQIARRERDSYNKLTESLSRLETMRMNEWQRSGGKSR